MTTAGVLITKNQFMSNFAGLVIVDDANHIVQNVSTANFFDGIDVEGIDNLIENNNFAYNLQLFGLRLRRYNRGGGPNIQNTWTNNLGVTQQPDRAVHGSRSASALIADELQAISRRAADRNVSRPFRTSG